jgi:hypothetical protein
VLRAPVVAAALALAAGACAREGTVPVSEIAGRYGPFAELRSVNLGMRARDLGMARGNRPSSRAWACWRRTWR